MIVFINDLLNNNAVFVSFNIFYQEPIIMTKYGCLSTLANILLFPQFCITVEARDASSAHRLTTDAMNERMTFIQIFMINNDDEM